MNGAGGLGLRRELARRLTPLALLIGVSISLVPPLIYYGLETSALERSAAVAAEHLADKVEALVFETPRLWKYQVQRYEELLRDFLSDREVSFVDVLDEQGTSIAGYRRSLGEPSRWRSPFAPLGRAPVRFNNREVGAVVVALPERPLMFRTLVLLVVTTVAGVTLAAVVYRLPVGMVGRMERDIDRRTAAQERLIEAGRRLASSLDVPEVLRRVTEVGRSLLPAAVVHIQLDGEGAPSLTAQAGDTASAPAPPAWLAPDVAPGRVLAVDDVVSDERLADRAWLTAEGVRSLLVVPLLFEQKPRGLVVWLCRAPQAWSASEVASAEALAVQAVLAVRNAELYADARDALAELEAAQETLVRGATLQALGQMTAGAAHHLNNLLTVVQGRVELLMDSVREPGTRQALAVVFQAAQDAAEVVRRMQQFGQRRPVQERVPVDLNEVADEAVQLTRVVSRDAAEAQGLTISVDLERAPVAPVLGSPAALREAVTNLVLNAIEALPRGGRVRLVVSQSERRVCLDVIDDGVGMTADVQRRAFVPFFTTKGVKRTGLGLSVAYGIVQEHGGDMELSSTEGRGTRVRLSLPAAEGVAMIPAAPALAARPRERALRVLVIDDEPMVRQTVADLVRLEGHEVHAAASGPEGLALLEHGLPIDLVLTDLGMPQMNGWEVARAVRGRWPAIRVALLTGWGNSPDVDAAGEEIFAVLAKPVTGETLQRLLAAVASKA
jgi:signal transduction histidine kinase/CheY-like chemotaxis protein